MHKLVTKVIGLLIVASALVLPVPGQAAISFSKAFSPNTIGPGSVSVLTFSIVNPDPVTLTNLAFSDTLPAGLTIADPSNAVSDCLARGGTITAPAGGGTISLEGAGMGTYTSCTVTVDITSAIVGTHTSISGQLTSDAGEHGNATANLTVAADRPGFTKAFLPDTVPMGSRSTLTFTIDNTANAAAATYLTFTDNLPVGMVIADPSNASTDCPESSIYPVALTAAPGSSFIEFIQNYVTPDTGLPAGTSCTVSIDVWATSRGLLGNSTEEFFSDLYLSISSGKANATLEATRDPLSLSKQFTDDPVPPGGQATLAFTIANFDRASTITNINFEDDLDVLLSGLTFDAGDIDPCGPGSVLTGMGTGLLTLSGGTLAPEASCTFSVTLQVPLSSVPGAYPGTTSTVTGDGATGNAASDTLFVHPAPLLAKVFTDDPVAAGSDVTLAYTITNTSDSFPAEEIAFTDELTTVLPFPLSVVLPAPGFCGAGSSLALNFLPGTDRQGLILTGADLAAGESCTFDVVVDIPADLAAGTYTSTTEAITGTIDGEAYTGNRAADDLSVVAGPTLRKSFFDDPVSAGDTVTLTYTLEHSAEVPGIAVDIAFTDDLAVALPGLTATGLPLNDPCGAGSTLTGTDMLELSGGSLDPGDTCAFSVTLETPPDAALGDHPSTTSAVTSTVGGISVTSPAASDSLTIASIDFSAEFIDDPVIPGDTATLRFSLDNVSAHDATEIIYTYNLSDTLPGVPDLEAVLPLPTEPCGAGSSLTGTTFLIFTGGSLAADAMCTFDVTVQVPAGTGAGTYISRSSNLTATLDGNPITVVPATDNLTIQTEWLALTKAFKKDSVLPGNTVEMTFTLTNLHPMEAASDIAFTDDLDAALSGLVVSTVLPIDDICGTGSQLSGISTLALTGGNLEAAASCEFTVTLSIPAGISPVTLINTTSQASGIVKGYPVTGASARDDIRVESLTFSEIFNQTGPTPAGETVTLSMTIENLDAALPVSGIGFTNDLDNTLSGLKAQGLPRFDVCGTGSTLSGTSFLTFSEGSLDAGESCTFDIQLFIPDSAATGVYLNTTSDLTSNGIVVSLAASATMDVTEADADGDPDSGGGGSSSTCFINALDARMAMPFGWFTGVAVIMMAIIGICRSQKER